MTDPRAKISRPFQAAPFRWDRRGPDPGGDPKNPTRPLTGRDSHGILISNNNIFTLLLEMLFSEFKRRYRRLPLIPAEQILPPGTSPQALRNQLSQWHRKGWLLRLRRGLYLLSDQDRAVSPSVQYLANQMYPPSYLSLEYALSHYGLIPESAAQVTSVTTRKTKVFGNRWGDFRYRHVARDLFWGFTALPDENGYKVLIAEPEKALLDFIYFNKEGLPREGGRCREMFADSFRFQNTEVLDRRKLAAQAVRFENSRLAAATAEFIKFMGKR